MVKKQGIGLGTEREWGYGPGPFRHGTEFEKGRKDNSARNDWLKI
jgi:hypothetical protein